MSGPFRTSPYAELEQCARRLIHQYETLREEYCPTEFYEEASCILRDAGYEQIFWTSQRTYRVKEMSTVFSTIIFTYHHSQDTLVELSYYPDMIDHNLSGERFVNVHVAKNAAELIKVLKFHRTQNSSDCQSGFFDFLRSIVRKHMGLPYIQEQFEVQCTESGLDTLLSAIPKEV